MKISSEKKNDIFYIFAQNIDCGYTFETPRRGVSYVFPLSIFGPNIRRNIYIPAYPSFTTKTCGLEGIHCTDMLT